jgi:acetyltransferase-like isoleucine patch superfamily enzyme
MKESETYKLKNVPYPMVFTNVYNPRAEISKMDQLRPILVKKGATIGANATIICGITMGRYCFIGASAVVTKNVLIMLSLSVIPHDRQDGRVSAEKNWITTLNTKKGKTA